MAFSCCDVTKTLLMRLKIIQDGGQLIIQVTISPKVKQM